MPVLENFGFFNQSIFLAADLHLPEGPGPHPAVVILHTANGGLRSYPFYQHLTRELPSHGWAVFLYDRRGSGASGGNFETASFSDLAEDALAAVSTLQSRADINPERIGVYGISQGGWIAPIAAARNQQVAFQIIVSSSGVSPAQQMDYAARYHLQKAGFPEEIIRQAIDLRSQVNEYYRGRLSRDAVRQALAAHQEEAWFSTAFLSGDMDLPVDVTREKWYYELDHDPLAAWKLVQQPSLFLFAGDDPWVPVQESIDNFKMVTNHLQDAPMVIIPETDHLMHENNDPDPTHVSNVYLEKMTGWLSSRI